MDVHIVYWSDGPEQGIAFYTQGLGLHFRRPCAPIGSSWRASVPIFLLVSNRPQDFAGPWTVHLDLSSTTRCRRPAGPECRRSVDRARKSAVRRMANMTDPFGNS
jgi:hypothetical protein